MKHTALVNTIYFMTVQKYFNFPPVNEKITVAKKEVIPHVIIIYYFD